MLATTAKMATKSTMMATKAISPMARTVGRPPHSQNSGREDHVGGLVPRCRRRRRRRRSLGVKGRQEVVYCA